MHQILAFVITASIAAAIALVVAYIMIVNGAKLGLVQVPNHRSSHTRPTPSGAGIGIAISAAICLAPHVYGMNSALVATLLVSFAGAVLGILDDRLDLPPQYRLIAHLILTGTIIYVTFQSWPYSDNFPIYALVILFVLTVLAATWWINLFNFMDGLDGLCATESIFILAAACYFISVNDAGATSIQTIMITVSSACVGFLIFNWPPARVFMGDSGSNFLAFVIIGTALSSISLGYAAYSTWAILPSLFVSDATVTFARRVLRGEKWYAAHKLHAYQKLSRQWRGHLPVTILFLLINTFWVLPLAVLAQYFPAFEWQITALCYLLPSLFFWQAGAGQPDILPSNR